MAYVSAEYEAARNAAALIDLSDRAEVSMKGKDRAGFLQRMCSNEVAAVPPGSGTEAFLLSNKGMVLAHVFVFASDDELRLDSAEGQAEAIVAHLDRYIIRDDVVLADRTAETAKLVLTGPAAADVLAKLGVAAAPRKPGFRQNSGFLDKPLDHTAVALADHPAHLRRNDLTGDPAYWIVARREDAEPLAAALGDAGAVPAGRPTFEILRVEAGTPLYGRDISDRNLPQEVARDAQAISLTKGCYVGQETVARLDALGHVNRLRVGLRVLSTRVPEPGCAVLKDGKPVGEITSAVFSPRAGAPLAMAYVRRGSHTPGTRLEVAHGDGSAAAEVVVLPLSPK